MANKTERLHLVFKTHLDIGFTDLAENVVRQYLEGFLPKAMDTARELRESGAPDRFVWTTGSWLIHEALERGDAAGRRRLENAIAAGDLTWHGLPFTTHTELMDAGLFRFGLGLAAELDRRFGKRTIAAKMTDVPGHTRAMVPLLAAAGIRFLHLGVNAASMPPEVPECFVWRHDDGSEIVVAYGRGGYGGLFQIPGMADALAFSHTGDNLGPQSAAQVREEFAARRRAFPGVAVQGSTLDAYAAALVSAAPALPVVTAEIGDTWIHGVGTDPGKVRRFRELCRAGAYSKNLLLVAEHTWGLDTKETVHAGGKTEFVADPVLPNPEFRQVRGQAKYRRWEASWREQRAYIGVEPAETPELPVAGQGGAALPGWVRQLRPTLIYEVFGAADYARFVAQYNPNLEETRGWAIPDFTKPGLEKTLAQGRRWQAVPGRVSAAGNGLAADFEFQEPPGGEWGCPAACWLHIENDTLTVAWRGKPASRVPEAIWIRFTAPAGDFSKLRMLKLGSEISPLDVVSRGARTLHAVEAVRGDGFTVKNLDAPLFAPGGPALLDFHDRLPAPSPNLHFCLYNNVWGTNFPMWYDEDAACRFIWIQQ